MSIINMLDTKDYDDVYDESEIHLPEDADVDDFKAENPELFAQDEPINEYKAVVNSQNLGGDIEFTIMAKSKSEAEKNFNSTYADSLDKELITYNWIIK